MEYIKITVNIEGQGRKQTQSIIINDGIAATSFSDSRQAQVVYRAMLKDKKLVYLNNGILIEKFEGKSKEEIAKLKIEETQSLNSRFGSYLKINYNMEEVK